jgi:hypothetical protein
VNSIIKKLGDLSPEIQTVLVLLLVVFAIALTVAIQGVLTYTLN